MNTDGTDDAARVGRLFLHEFAVDEEQDVAARVNVRHWIDLYDELLRFTAGVVTLIEVRRGLLSRAAGTDVTTDMTHFTEQISRYLRRLNAWVAMELELAAERGLNPPQLTDNLGSSGDRRRAAS